MVRKTQQVETRMLPEYIFATYPKFPSIIKVPLGKVDEGLQAQVGYQQALGLTRPYRPEADAVVILPNYLVLIETKVWSVIDGLAKLPMYKSLVEYTPELQPYLPREVIMELVVAWSNSNLEIMCKEAGVRLKVFSPPWLQDVVNKYHSYWTADARKARADKLALRQFLGVE